MEEFQAVMEEREPPTTERTWGWLDWRRGPPKAINPCQKPPSLRSKRGKIWGGGGAFTGTCDADTVANPCV